jgi:ubiquinone/menaquinone biosynthesis C-methylase UbiE
MPREAHKDEVRRMFDALAHDYFQEREEHASFQKQKAAVLDLLEGARGRILDIGCGPAVMQEALLQRGFEVCGLDASPEMIRFGRQRILPHLNGGHCHLLVGDAEALACTDRQFDAVLSMGMLEYLPSYDRALREMHRALRPGGMLVLTVPNRLAPYNLARGAREWMRRLAGRADQALRLNRCLPWRLDREIAAAGFRKVETAMGRQYIVKAIKV